MLNQPVQDAINNQIRDEFYASHLYLSMSAYFEAEGLPGFASWMRKQSKEEREHALKFFDYVHDRGGRVVLQPVGEVASAFESPLDVFKKAYEHECKVTASIKNIYEVAGNEKDYATQVMLHWFLEEQVEEEKNATDVIDMLERVGSSGQGLLMADRQLGAR
jgi:ferritin